jgi:hypothetical protein
MLIQRHCNTVFWNALTAVRTPDIIKVCGNIRFRRGSNSRSQRQTPGLRTDSLPSIRPLATRHPPITSAHRSVSHWVAWRSSVPKVAHAQTVQPVALNTHLCKSTGCRSIFSCAARRHKLTRETMCDRHRSDSITNDAPGGGPGAVVVAPSCTVNVYSHKVGSEVELCTGRPDRGAGGRGATGQAGVGRVETTTQTSKRCEVVVCSRPPNRTNQFKTPVPSRVNGSYFTPQDTSSNSFPGQWFRFHTPGDQFSQKTV